MAERRESVRLSLIDDFTGPMARVVATTEAAKRALDDLNGTQVDTADSSSKSRRALGDLSTAANKTSADVDRLTSAETKQRAQLQLAQTALASMRTELEGAVGDTSDLEAAISRQEKTVLRYQSRLNQTSSTLHAYRAAVAVTTDESERLDEVTRRFTGSFSSSRLSMVNAAKGMDGLTASALALGPALVPLAGAGAGVGAWVGMTAGVGAAAGAVGVLTLALHGLGDGLKAIQTYRLDPTTANLVAMQQALHGLGPAGAQFDEFLVGLEPKLKSLQDTARSGLFPGVEAGIESLLTRLPQVRIVIGDIAKTLGGLSAEGGAALAGPEFDSFFTYLKREAGPTLHAFATAAGNTGEALANMVVAFGPVTRDFTDGLVHMSASFAQWSRGLSTNTGFEDFVDYVRQSGPQAIHLIDSLASTLLAVGAAARPWGAVMLPVLNDAVKVLGLIARSPAGPALFTLAAAMGTVNRVSALAGAGLGKFNLSTERTATLTEGLNKALGVGAGFAIFETGMQSADVRTRAFQGTLGGITAGLSIGGPWGGAIGGAIGLISSFADQHKIAAVDVNTLTSSLNSQTGAITENTRLQVLNSLASQGILKDAQSLGLNLGVVTDAALGSSTALKEFNVQSSAAFGAGTNEATNQAVYRVTDAVSGQSKSVAAATAKWKLISQAQSESTQLSGRYTGAAQAAAGATDQFGAATGRIATSATQAKLSLSALTTAMQQQRQAALSGFDAETQYRQALKDAATQAAKSQAGIKGNSTAALANRTALSGLASAWNNQSTAVQNNTTRYEQARKAFIDTATAMGVSSAAAQNLANRVLNIPQTATTAISNNASIAQRGLEAYSHYLSHLNGQKATTYIDNVVRTSHTAGNYTSTGRTDIPLPGMAAGGLLAPIGAPAPCLPAEFAA